MNRASCIVHRDRGFTLIEIVMIIVVVAVAIPALLIVLGQGTRQGVDAELQVSGSNVAQALMEEIKTKRWDENNPSPPYSDLSVTDGGETAGNPATYDDVDDYNNGVPDTTVSGVTYSRSVEVCYVQSSDLNNTSPCITASGSATDYKRIKVTATNATIGSIELVTLVTNY
ncbi:MAG: hypothetical protein HY754_01680 [Nitrospirae bacterium]|nr:hypothetical protein [Nitrospirota bacterium]